MAVQRIESLVGAVWTSVGGKAIKRLRVLTRLAFIPNEAGAIISGTEWHWIVVRLTIKDE